MLNILKKKQNKLTNESFNPKNVNKLNTITKIDIPNIHSKYNKQENIIYYPSSSKEWFNSIYSYHKSYSKLLIVYTFKLNEMLSSYCNMYLYRTKVLFKRRRHNKSRYSANRVYVSRPELKHTNTKILIILYTYNKKKLSYIKDLIKSMLDTYLVKRYKFNSYISDFIKVYKVIVDNLFTLSLQNDFSVFNKWKIKFFRSKDNLLKYSSVLKRAGYYSRLLRKLINLQKEVTNITKLVHFNRFKFNNFILELNNLGLINLIKKMYNKNIEIKVVELKSLHLNSDIFSYAVALKLRDRKNKAIRVLRKAILQKVKIPDLHTITTFDDNIETINKHNVLNTIKQQIVSGVRFEASGRLTKRLTAMRAIFKYRYVGSLKNIRSSFNNKASTLLRGHVKANSQYTVINSKTRNGAFGLKGWVSSH
jgi:hypothetical protein